MKLVASSKLKRSLHDVSVARPYAARLDSLYRKLGHFDSTEHPLFKSRPMKKIKICLITSDKGLCGPFNNQLIKVAEEEILRFRENGIDPEMIAIGRKGFEGLRRRIPDLSLSYRSVSPQTVTETANELVQMVIAEGSSEKLDSFFLLFNRFETVFLQTPELRRLFPPLPPETEEPYFSSLIEPDPPSLLETIVPKRLFSQIQLALLESAAGENGARMSAMDNATRNSADLIDRLTVTANRMRQAAITTELTEIVSGAEALNG